MAGILVVAEASGGAVAPVSYELLGAARKLSSEGGGNISAFVAGAAGADDLLAHGAGAVYIGTNAALESGSAEVFLPAVSAAIEQSGADIVLLGQTSLGRDLGPALAFALKSGVSMDTVGLSIEGGRLKATRSCYGGNARAELTWKAPVQIATVKAKSFDETEAAAGASGNKVNIDAAGAARVQILSTERAQSTGVNIQDAPVVVSGGRGLGDPSAFAMLEELAGLLKGATGASRAACDMGWYPQTQQVGLTGKVVSPDMYIAVGISGASQHMAGMSGSKNIIAINRDPEANMVKAARFAIVEDYKKIVPTLIEEVRKLLA